MRKDVYVEDGTHLQKALSQAGVTSRHTAETLIAEGRVQVDGQIIRFQGIRIDPYKQSVHIDGGRVFLDEAKYMVIAVSKPVGVMSTVSSPEGCPTLADLVVDYPERLHNVGRSDTNTSNPLLLTNDGELTNRLAHPSYEAPKTYVAHVCGGVKPYARHKLVGGIELKGDPIEAGVFRVIDTYGGTTSVEIVVYEGRNRLVRHMMDQVGYPVRELVRTVPRPIRLDRLQPGNSRRMKGNTLKAFCSCVGL